MQARSRATIPVNLQAGENTLRWTGTRCIPSASYGLSYTTFSFENLRLSASEIHGDESLEVLLDVTNTGSRAGATVAQIYVDDHYTSVVRPIMELKGFQRVELEAGETKTLHFTLGFDELRLLDASYHWVVEPGDFTVLAGANAGDLPLRADFRVV